MRIFSGLQKPDGEGARKAEDPTFEWIFFLICKILEAGEGRKVQRHKHNMFEQYSSSSLYGVVLAAVSLIKAQLTPR
jgi:hypothetical protein